MNWDRFSDEAIYLDANIVIFSVEAREPWSSQLRPLFDAFDQGEIRGVTSELTLSEVLVKPIALGDQVQLDGFQELFAPGSMLELLAIDRKVLMLAAEIRAQMKLKLFDAIHVATARIAGCEHFLTQDERLGRALGGSPKWLQLSESM